MPIPIRLLNVALRLGSLAAKLGLMLYMARYMKLADIGAYGLVAAWVVIAVTFLGMRLDYVVQRDIVDAVPLQVAARLRDQVLFYGLNYLVLALATLPFLLKANGLARVTLPLAILESFAATMSGNFVSLKRPVLGSFLFFIRAALWTFPLILLGVMSPSFRTIDAVFAFWIGGNILSILAMLGAARHFPWVQALRQPVDWIWIRDGVKRSFLIWLGAIGESTTAYIDRFAVEHYLNRDYVGLASFYGSFVIAIPALLQSGVFAFFLPRLISHHRGNAWDAFRRDAIAMCVEACALAGLLSLIVGLAVPWLGDAFQRPEYARHAPVLWLMLLGAWLKSTTDGVHYVLYARHQDRVIGIGGVLIFIPASITNVILVPICGFIGIGYSAVIIALFYWLWRGSGVMLYRPPPR